MEVADIINVSGNVFHYRVVQFLRDNGWTVLVSPFYNDNLTDKPREIDVIAEKAFDVNDLGRNWQGTLNVKLFIECKYVNKPTVFWFDEKDKDRSVKRIVKDTGLDRPIHNVTISEHRLFKLKEVAKLFASEKGQDNDIVYKAINQSLNAMIYYKNTPTLIQEDQPGSRKILKTINYPVVLCSSFDNFYKIDARTEGSQHLKIEENFNLEINYAYLNKEKESRSDYFLIDIVDFNKLPNFLSELEKSDVDVVRGDMSWKIRKNTRSN